jgi:hypothetical protein
MKLLEILPGGRSQPEFSSAEGGENSQMDRRQMLLRRIRLVVGVFIAGLILSGATAIPLQSGVEWLVHVTGANHAAGKTIAVSLPSWELWLTKVQDALSNTQFRYPFLFYGTDWLAFGHFAIAIAFVGAWRDPVRNRWLFTFGLIACLLVIPYAMVFGAVRGIPVWWRLVDCSFGIFGLIPILLCRHWVAELEGALSET